jgi:hypothetical protein
MEVAMTGSKGIKLLAAGILLSGCFASAANAQSHWGHHGHHGHHDDVDAGDVIAGAAVIGGLAALASAISRDNRERQDAAVDSCADEAEFRTHGRVSEIVNVRKSKGYYTVEGLIDAEQGPGASFLCTVRHGRIYSFRSSGGEGPGAPLMEFKN